MMSLMEPDFHIKKGSLASQTQPTPARIAFSIKKVSESDPRWGWLGLACETNEKQECLAPRD